MCKSKLIEHAKEKLSFKVPAYITRSIRFLESIHPYLATKLAMFIFFRPIPFKTPSRESDCLKAAEKEARHTGKSTYTAYKWIPRHSLDKKILLVHGWSGRATQFFALIEALTEAGYTVYGIDAPAHGQNPGKRTNMLEFVDAISDMHEAYGKFDAVIGHSLGGMALFNAIERIGISQHIVLIGSPASVPNVVGDFCEKVGASPKVAQRICKRIERDFNVSVDKVSTDYLAQKHNPDGLIIHDEDDLDVDVSNARAIAKSWPKGKLILSKGLGHRRVLKDEDTVAHILAFLNAKLNNEASFGF